MSLKRKTPMKRGPGPKRKTTLAAKRAGKRRTLAPRCVKLRCDKIARIGPLCVTHADAVAWREFSIYVRTRDNRCTAEGMFNLDCNGGLQAAHVVGRRKQSTRFDPENVHALCMAHHSLVDQHHEFGAKVTWAIAVLGEERFEALMARAQQTKDRNVAIAEALEFLGVAA